MSGLEKGVAPRVCVKHVGLIPDGGRRWAIAHGCSLAQSYNISMVKIGQMLTALFSVGVAEVSIYLLSKKNLRRTQFELDTVAEAETTFIVNVLADVKREYPFDVNIAGTWELAPQRLRAALALLPAVTRPLDRKVTLVVAYDPFDEVAHAVGLAPPNSSAAELREKFWVPTPLDLVIRTGGAITLSDFLPVQASYARLLFLETLFNDLSVEEVMSYVDQHEQGSYKFGE